MWWLQQTTLEVSLQGPRRPAPTQCQTVSQKGHLTRLWHCLRASLLPLRLHLHFVHPSCSQEGPGSHPSRPSLLLTGRARLASVSSIPHAHSCSQEGPGSHPSRPSLLLTGRARLASVSSIPHAHSCSQEGPGSNPSRLSLMLTAAHRKGPACICIPLAHRTGPVCLCLDHSSGSPLFWLTTLLAHHSSH